MEDFREQLEQRVKEIEKIILSQRQVDFIESERENLYNNAIQSGKLKRYEK